jgi:hypothetical protein
MTNPADRIPDSVSPRKGIETEKPTSQPSSAFESYMQEPTNKTAQPGFAGNTAPIGATPMELTKPVNFQTGTPTMNTLLTQSANMQDSLGTVGDQLKTPNLKLKRSQAHLVKNKLQDANGYLHAAGDKLGVETPPSQIPSGLAPPARFLAMLGDGQDQLMAVQQKIKELSATEGGISPADMMFLQVKMGQAQQEIEYSSTLLGKVIQSITQLLQTQL